MNAHAVQSSRARFALNLHPSRCNDALEGVRDQLNILLTRWSEGLDGVLMAYNNERILSSKAPVLSYFPYIHVEVLADVLLFRPRAGMVLCGSVSKVGADFLGLLVLGIFNTAIGRQQIRSDLTHRESLRSSATLGACWQSRQRPDHRICEGDQVLFTVQRVNTHGSIWSITGAMEQPQTGALSFLAANPPTSQAQLQPPVADVPGPRGANDHRRVDKHQPRLAGTDATVDPNQHLEADNDVGPKGSRKKKRRKIEQLEQLQEVAIGAIPLLPNGLHQAKQGVEENGQHKHGGTKHKHKRTHNQDIGST